MNIENNDLTEDRRAGKRMRLTAWVHPSTKYPEESDFKFDAKANPIYVIGSQTIDDLMALFEVAFERASAGRLEVTVTTLWNTLDHTKALHPLAKISEHFRHGDTFGVFGDIKLTQLRFAVGTRVLCRTGETTWDAGTIAELNYRESHWPPGRKVPYFVELDDGDSTYVPEDVNFLCKKLVPPWWASLLAEPGADRARELRMVSHDKDVDARNHLGETALMTAVALKWMEGVQALLEMKAAVDFVDNKGECALHRACSHGPAMLGLLLAAKANPNLQDIDPDFDPQFTSTTFGDHPEHRTPLHYACLRGDLESSRLLVHGRADLNIQDGQRKTPLHLAIEEDHYAIIDFLLLSGAAVDVCSIESGMKNSPLMEAAHKGKHLVAGKLLASSADVNKVGKQDMTALHLAARRGDPKMVKILLDARADLTLESKCGTSLHLARKTGSAELLQLFGVSEASSAGAPLT